MKIFANGLIRPLGIGIDQDLNLVSNTLSHKPNRLNHYVICKSTWRRTILFLDQWRGWKSKAGIEWITSSLTEILYIERAEQSKSKPSESRVCCILITKKQAKYIHPICLQVIPLPLKLHLFGAAVSVLVARDRIGASTRPFGYVSLWKQDNPFNTITFGVFARAADLHMKWLLHSKQT